MGHKKVAYYGLFSALALLMSYVELLIPLNIMVPGIKLGLSNVIVLITLYTMGAKDAFYISFVRILLTGLLFAGFAGFLYSAAGAALSFLAMTLFKKWGQFSIVGVSVVGGVFHNVGQITVAALVVDNTKLYYYLPVLLFAGVGTGILTGILAKYSLPYLRNFY